MTNVQTMWQGAAAVERYVTAEKMTRQFCKILVDKSNLASTTADKKADVLDLACGTGAAIAELYEAVPKDQWGNLKVLGADASEAMLSYLEARGKKEEWSGLETRVVDGNIIDLPEGTYTHVFIAFAIFIMPGSLPKLLRLVKPGGFIGITTWGALAWYDLFKRSISQLSPIPYIPSKQEVEAKLSPGHDWASASYVASKLSELGFENVQTEQRRLVAGAGRPKAVLETLQFPLTLYKGGWGEGADEVAEEVSKVVLRELEEMAGDGEGEVEFEFDGIVGWGYRPE